MRRPRLIPLVLAALLALAPAADAKHKRKHHCAISGGAVVAKSKVAVILSRDVAYSELEDATEFYGCLRSRKRPFFIASASSDQYGSSHIHPYLLRGTFFAYGKDLGFIDGSCQASVTIYALRKRESAYAPATGQDGKNGDCPAIGRVLLDRQGRSAWIAEQSGQSFIRKLDADGAATLDQGTGVDPASLLLGPGGMLTWANGGEPRSAVLR